jgi:hypothetical protein
LQLSKSNNKKLKVSLSIQTDKSRHLGNALAKNLNRQ